MSKTYGFDEFEKRLLRLAKETPDKIDKQVARMQMMVLADTKQGTPVGKVQGGNLKRKWTVGNVIDGKGEVGTNVDYALPVEKGFIHANGGQKIPGHHMLEKAVEQQERRLPDEMKRFFNELAGDLKL